MDEDAGYVFEADSDQERGESSDDEIDMWLNGTPEQKRKIRRRSLGQCSSSDDDFEKEMEKELSATMKAIEADRQVAGTSTSGTEQKTEEKKYYDDIYYDSDEENSPSNEKNEKHAVLSNDDLLYDPKMDEEDQQWVDDQRRQYHQKSLSSKAAQKAKPLPNSDAVLNCPACLTTLCLDCQRHSLYKDQYRAMFVKNCTVDKTELLKFPQKSQSSKKKGRKRKHKSQQELTDTDASEAVCEGDSSAVDDLYHPVRCTRCNTQVGVFDTDEIFHFFNVLESYG